MSKSGDRYPLGPPSLCRPTNCDTGIICPVASTVVSAYMSSQCCGGNDGSISQSTQREMRSLCLPHMLECGVIPTVDASFYPVSSKVEHSTDNRET